MECLDGLVGRIGWKMFCGSEGLGIGGCLKSSLSLGVVALWVDLVVERDV